MSRLRTWILAILALPCGLALPGAAFGGGPDSLYFLCVNTEDRAGVRAERAACDDFATADAYNVGIFGPVQFHCDNPPCKVEDQCPNPCTGACELYECSGAPGQSPSETPAP